MSAEGHYANRNSLKPPWVSTIELTPAGGGNKGEVVQASYKGKCPCNPVESGFALRPQGTKMRRHSK